MFLLISVADPNPVGSGLFGSAGSGSEIVKTGSAEPDPNPVQMRTDPLSTNRPCNSTLIVL